MKNKTGHISVKEFLDQDQKKDLIRILTAGSVDDGKSTLIGRLMFDSKTLYEDQISTLEKDSKRTGHAGGEIDYALLLDGLKAEREQGITIDVAYRYFSTNRRKFIIADTPGHEQYTRNMVTGASTANLAIILIDATKGVITQTRRHTYIVSLLGIKHVVLAVNKMDLVGFKERVFEDICSEYRKFVSGLNISDINFIPLSALRGDNVVGLSENMQWYQGKSMMEFLETIYISSDRNFEDLRFPVQYVLRPDKNFRGFSARVLSGFLHKGDEVMVLPSQKESTIKTILVGSEEKEYAFAPQSITLTLEDEIDISRGEMLVHRDNLPRVERHFESMMVWMDEKPMDLSIQYLLKQNTSTVRARIDKISYKTNINTLEKEYVDFFDLNDIGRVILTTSKPIIFDPYKRNRNTGAFVLIDPISNNTCAVGMIIDKLGSEKLNTRITDFEKSKIESGESLISAVEREKRYRQKGLTIWITGLHGSGKNELAYKLERKLFDNGANVILLDGSTVRSGLSRELDHSHADRAEHLRRVAHIARILNDQGIIVVCSFISPGESIRNQVAEIIGKERFKLIYMDADLEFSKKNKPYLYNLAKDNRIKYLPGYDIEYEIPTNPDLSIEPGINNNKIDQILDLISDFFLFD